MAKGENTSTALARIEVSSLPAFSGFGGKDEVREDLDRMRIQLEEVLPSQVDPARFLRVAASAIIKSPKLMECTKVSIFGSLLEAATLGLEPSGLLGSAYLVPYRRKVEVDHPERPGVKISGWITEAKLIPGYRGLIDLARRSGGIRAIWANVVYRKDDFRILQGSTPEIEHAPFVADPSGSAEERDPGPMVGAYMVAVMESGEKQIEWMSADQIDSIRARSKSKDDGPWVSDPEEMSRKTVVRRGSKYLPLSPEFRRALELDEEAERFATADPSPRSSSKAMEILRNRRSGTVEEAPEGPETGLEGQEESEEGKVSTPEVEGPEIASVEDPGLCGADPSDGPNKLGFTQPCAKPAGHGGSVHASEEGSWPTS